MSSIKTITNVILFLSLFAFFNFSGDLFADNSSDFDKDAVTVIRDIFCSKNQYEGDKKLYILDDLKGSNFLGINQHFKEINSKESILYIKALRNEIFARHGRVFKSLDLLDIFGNCNWYRPNKSYSDTILNEFERKNVEFISDFEKQRDQKQSAETKSAESESESQTTGISATKGVKTDENKNEPLTEEEIIKVNDEFKVSSEISESQFENDKEIMDILRILLKGNHKTFHINTPYMPDVQKGDDQISRFQYSDTIGTLLTFLSPKDAFPFAIKILKTMTDYPEMTAKAAEVLNLAKDKSTIPLLRDVARYPAPGVRYEAARALLTLGDGDTALPILDNLAIKEGYSAALYSLFSGAGKIIDERGYAIVEKALKNPKAEVRISAVKLLFDSQKITKEKAEELALGLLNELKNNTLKDYGLMAINSKESIEVKAIPGSNPAVAKAYSQFSSDSRACEMSAGMLGQFRSKKALPTLHFIASRETEWWYTCKWGVKAAVETIEKSNGGPK